MKTKTWINKTTALALLVLQTLSLSARAQADEEKSFCDLRIRPTIELTNTTRVTTIEGAFDYNGRTWIADGISSTACIVGAPLMFMGIIFCLQLYTDTNPEGFRKSNSFYYAQKNDQHWYDGAFRDITQACGKYIKKHYKDDIIENDGEIIRARNYTCSAPRAVETSKGFQIEIDVLKGTPVYNNLNLDQIRAEKCTRLLSCYAEASETEALEWIQQKQLELGCN